MEIVVEHLVLEAERSVVGSVGHRDFFGDVVLDAAISSRRNLPLPRELEIPKGVLRHQIATGGRLAIRQSRHLAISEFSDRAVFDLPVRRRHRVVAEASPAIERFPIEQ